MIGVFPNQGTTAIQFDGLVWEIGLVQADPTLEGQVEGIFSAIEPHTEVEQRLVDWGAPAIVFVEPGVVKEMHAHDFLGEKAGRGVGEMLVGQLVYLLERFSITQPDPGEGK